LIAKNFFKVIYKLEMNFSLRSFGLKEPEDTISMMEYIISLFEFSIYVIKNEREYLRANSVCLLAVWGRIHSECLGSKMEQADTI